MCFKIYVLSLCTTLLASSALSASSWESVLKKYKIPKEDVSLEVQFDDPKEMPYRWLEKKLRIPASLTKIVSVATVIDRLALDYKWKSILSSSAQIKNQTLLGDLCFNPGGNPSLITESMRELVDRFLRNQIYKISGDLVVDESFFDNEYYDGSRQKTRVIRAYDSPVSGASFNWNSANIFVRASNAVGEPAKIFIQPENEYVQLENKVTTDRKSTHIEIERQVKKGVEKFLVSGRIGIEEEEKVFYRSIQNAALWTGSNLYAQLLQKKVVVEGKVKLGICSRTAKEMAEVESKDLSLVVRDTMKYSNNFLTELMVKTIAAQRTKTSGSMEAGIKEIHNFLKEKSLDPEDLYIESVSGFSRENQFKAKALVDLLKIMKKDFTVSYDFISSFPVSAVDGTLKKRLKKIPKAYVRAKTGLLNGVVGLAGYGQSKKEKSFQFAMIFNGSPSLEPQAKLAFDEILTKIVGER